MELTKKNSLHLYHYCTSITDALRPYLNAPEVGEIDKEYWVSSLTRFKKVIETILGDNSNSYQELHKTILNGLLANKDFRCLSSIILKDDIKKIIDLSFEITKDVWNDLHGEL